MANKNRMKLAGSFMSVMFAAGLIQGCSAAEDGVCEFDAELENFNGSVDALVAAEADLRAQLAYACAQIAGDDSVPEDNDVDSDQLQTLCASASAKIEVEVEAGLVIEYVEPVCTVNIDAQANCEAECTAKFECMGGDIKARCTGGEVSVQCEGSCEASGRCEAEVNGPAVTCEGSCSGSCTGSCEGTCNGQCEGTCNGKCEGECSGGTDEEGNCNGECTGECQGSCEGSCSGSCSGSCMGECQGSCEVQPGSASASCEGEFRCEGTCEGEATAPKCSGEVTPVECEGDAGCNADCKASFAAEASCTEPTLTVSGGADATVVAEIQAHLGTVYEVAAQLDALGAALLSTGNAAVELGGEISGGCAAKWGADLTAKFEAAGEAAGNASASASVTVDVSASASGSAG